MHKKVMHISSLFILCATFLLSQFYTLPTSATDTTFEVNIKEVLSISITAPNTWASGNVNDFLRNVIELNVSSNNANGFTAGMTTATNSTELTNTNNNLSNMTIPTLTSNVNCANASCADFPTNSWGYSIDDNFNTGTYEPLVDINSTPVTILSNNNATSASSNIYFGAKADITKASGTYNGAVIITVVSGVNSNNSTPTPNNSISPNSNTLSSNTNSEPTNSPIVYTTSSVSNNNTTNNQISEGDTTNSYVPAQGVTESSISNIHNDSPATTILATTASIAAGSGILLFILAKNKKDDKEELTE